MRERRYRPLPARRVLIPKPGLKDQYRPLSIPAVRVRVVQAAVKIVLEPVFETDIADCFSAIPHEKLMQAIEERVCDQSVLPLPARPKSVWPALTEVASAGPSGV